MVLKLEQAQRQITKKCIRSVKTSSRRDRYRNEDIRNRHMNYLIQER